MADPVRTQRDLLFAVFFTNLLSLACQVIWVRKLAFLFGSTAAVFATVLGVFLLGLALGALWGGLRVDRSPQPRRLLSRVLMALGVCCAASLPLFDLLRRLYLALAPPGLSPLAAAVSKTPVVLLALFLPTLCIGAVFPVAVRLYARGNETLGADLSVVYALDTLGAAAGAVLGGFLLVPRVGLLGSTVLLGAAAVALGAFLGRKPGPAAVRRPPAALSSRPVKSPAPAGPPLPRHHEWLILWTFMATGGAALLLETGWNRFFYVLNGTSVFSNSVVLAGFLAGLGAGSLAMRRFIDRTPDLYAGGAYLFAAIAAGGMLVFRSTGLFERGYLAFFRASDSYLGFQILVCGLIFGVIFLPALALGANFPLVARICSRAPESRGFSVGRVFFFNTLGAVAGAFLGEFVLLPHLGFGGLALVVLATYAAAAAVFLGLAKDQRRWRHVGVCAALLAGAGLLSPLLIEFRLPFHALYYHGLRARTLAAYRSQAESMQVRWERDGFYGRVAVVQLGEHLLLKHNGKTDASNSPGDNYAQLLLSHLPLLLHPDPRAVLNIGLGGGVTLRGITHHRGVEEITQVEIDPLVVDAARLWFAPFNERALDDPRVKVVTTDGRNFIEGAPGAYDVIISEPPNLWVAGVSGLFTQEFYRAAHAHLRPGGILSQWLPLHELERDDFAVALKTLTSVFSAVVVYTNGSDAILLASDLPLAVDPERLAGRLADPKVAADLAAVGIAADQVLPLLQKPQFPGAEVAALARRVEDLNRDDRPILEFATARNLFYFNKR